MNFVSLAPDIFLRTKEVVCEQVQEPVINYDLGGWQVRRVNAS